MSNDPSSTPPPDSPADPDVVFQQLADYEKSFDVSHRAGTMSATSLREIFQAVGYNLGHSVETGCGKSTILFSLFSKQHRVFTYDDRSDARSSIGYFEQCPFASKANVQFVLGSTQKTVAAARFDRGFDVVFLDGAHGYPFADLEYYYFYPHLKTGSFLILDDIHIPSIARMADILAEDAMYGVVAVVEKKTLILRRTDAPTLDPLGDGWLRQDYNRRRVPWAPTIFLNDGKKRESFLPPAASEGKTAAPPRQT